MSLTQPMKINFWRTIAVAFLCQQVEQAAAMTMLGPGHHDMGQNLAQTSASSLQIVSPAATLAQLADVPDDDPCHNQLTTIFEDDRVKKDPADVMLDFMVKYCVEEADEFLPSKYLH